MRESDITGKQLARSPFWRPIAAGAVVAAGVILVLTGLVVFHLRTTAINSAVSQMKALDLVLGAQTERSFAGVDLVLTGIVDELRASGVDSLAAYRAKSDPQTFRRLREKLSVLPQLEALFLVDAQGNVINRTLSDPTAPEAKVADRDYFVALRDDPELVHFVSKPAQGRASGRWNIYIAQRINAPDGTFLGVVVGAMPVAHIENFYRDILTGMDGRISLWRGDGTLMAQFPSLGGPLGQSYDLAEEFHNLANHGGSATFWTMGKIAPVEMAVSEQALRDFPLILSVVRDKSSILGPWQIEASVWSIGAGILLSALAITVWLLSRQLNAYAAVAEARAKASHEAEAREKLQSAVDRAETAMRDLQRSEARFRDIAEVGSDWIWESNDQHRFTMALGEAALGVEKFGLASPVGRTRWDATGGNPEKDEIWRAHKAELDAHRPFRNFRFATTSLTGEKVHLCVSGKPVFDDAGRFLGYRGTVTDETARVEAMRRADSAEALLRDAIESISEGFAIYDDQDRLVIFNSAYRSLYPENAAIVRGMRYEDILTFGTEHDNSPVAKLRTKEWLEGRLNSAPSPGRRIRASIDRRSLGAHFRAAHEQRLDRRASCRHHSPEASPTVAARQPGAARSRATRRAYRQRRTRFSHQRLAVVGRDLSHFRREPRKLHAEHGSSARFHPSR